jgi:sulfoxide reductase catalytic subunit YedY
LHFEVFRKKFKMKKDYKSVQIDRSEITPKSLYLSRREFMRAAGLVVGGVALAACVPALVRTPSGPPTPTPTVPPNTYKDELGNPANSFYDITHYNNYYEFTTDKLSVAAFARNFPTTPWSVQVYGLVQQPKTYSVSELVNLFQPEERVYRMRCVEGWSLVIPWIGFPLSKLLNAVQPNADAKYVRFETVMDRKDMEGQTDPSYPWPYQEGLRLDEAMNDLAILATGMYGGALPNQDGAPIRLVVPWKYGLKSIKAIVKIELVAEQPATMWDTISPGEYGFYSNVNPNVDHPRWSQATEQRIGENSRRKTLMFNGYEQQVGYLYKGMDLKANY